MELPTLYSYASISPEIYGDGKLWGGSEGLPKQKVKFCSQNKELGTNPRHKR